jgi:predicted component of type VI protein secretion system
MKAELVPDNGDPPIPILRDLTVVGRREYADIVIDHASLSKRHCLLVKTDGLLIIRDLITTNGTKVKGQRIRWAALLPDDRVTLGEYKMRVYLGPDDAPTPSELYEERKRAPAPPAPRAVSRSADDFSDPYAGTRGLAQFTGFAAPSSIDDIPVPSPPQGDRRTPPQPPPRGPFTFVDDDDDLIDLG